jgi:transcriptional regulator with XRE-family HTH domain
MREEVGVSLRQMAEEIGFSPTYLSAVEMGEKGVTDDLVDKVVGFLRKRGRKTKDFARLKAAVDRTRRSVDVGDLNGMGRLAVAEFARKWADFDRETREDFLRRLDLPDEEK